MRQQGFSVRMPVPPSVNHMHRSTNNGMRYSTAEYRAWARNAGWEVLMQKPATVRGPYEVMIMLPPMRGDADNRIKPVLDLLHRLHLTDDDSLCKSTQVLVVEDLKPGYALVTVREHIPQEAVKKGETLHPLMDAQKPVPSAAK